MEIYNPTYNSEKNKIVAYLENPKTFFGWENSKIEIEVDDELKKYILNTSINARLKNNVNIDITPIMDRIEISKQECDGSCFGECVNEYTAKLKQVDKVVESKMDKETIKGKLLNEYINAKHTQEECVGFIDGYDVATKLLTEQLDKYKTIAESESVRADNLQEQLANLQSKLTLSEEKVKLNYNSAVEFEKQLAEKEKELSEVKNKSDTLYDALEAMYNRFRGTDIGFVKATQVKQEAEKAILNYRSK